jgi:hypothetical protein
MRKFEKILTQSLTQNKKSPSGLRPGGPFNYNKLLVILLVGRPRIELGTY